MLFLSNNIAKVSTPTQLKGIVNLFRWERNKLWFTHANTTRTVDALATQVVKKMKSMCAMCISVLAMGSIVNRYGKN